MSQTDIAENTWLRHYQPPAPDRIRLVCFPHAGGSASFYAPMSRALRGETDVLAVQYPGRQDRRREPLLGDIGTLADRTAEAVLPWHESGPVAFFGHSMGAIVAFETARRLERRTGKGPLVIFASGRRAPGHAVTETVHQRDDNGLIAELRQLSGTDSTLFDDEELLMSVLPAIRSDYRAIETYRAEPGAKVGCPVVALVGDRDPRVSVADTARWAEHTTGAFSRQVFPGGHFYLSDQAPAVLARVRDTLTSWQ
jgi:surfactin synthase thioesterase subunit